MDTSEAALVMRLTREQVIRAIQKGILRGELVNGRYRVDRASLQEWQASRLLPSQEGTGN